MTTQQEPRAILKNGLPNPEWITWKMQALGWPENKARMAWSDNLKEMAEPSLTNSTGGPSPIWITWWKARNPCTRNIALNVCKAKIAGTYVANRRTNDWLNQKKTAKFLESL